MSPVRTIVSAALAGVITFGLLLLMNALIEFGDKSLDEGPATKIADITMPDIQIEANVKEQKPDKPDDPEEPPPPLDSPQVEFDVSPTAVNMAVSPQADVSLGSGLGLGASDGEYLPIVKVAAVYPRRAQTRGITGYCIVEYTVTTTVATRDPVPIDCQPSGVFERASVRAAEKFKYKPRVIDGEPVEVAGVQNRFIYELEE